MSLTRGDAPTATLNKEGHSKRRPQSLPQERLAGPLRASAARHFRGLSWQVSSKVQHLGAFLWGDSVLRGSLQSCLGHLLGSSALETQLGMGTREGQSPILPNMGLCCFPISCEGSHTHLRPLCGKVGVLGTWPAECPPTPFPGIWCLGSLGPPGLWQKLGDLLPRPCSIS